jgi:hypothetical protein
LQLETETHYENLNKKLDDLQANRSKRPTNTTRGQKQTFYPRTVNVTDIIFTKEEQELLDLGAQHSIQRPLKTYWNNLIIETESAVRLLDTRVQDAFRLLATKKLKQIQNTHQNLNHTHKRQQHIAKNIQHKITKNNALITLTDKGKTTVIIYKKDYEEKVHTFLTDNNILSLPGDHTKKHQNLISKTMQQCNLILHKKQIRHWTQKTPPTPPQAPIKTTQTRHPHKTYS